MKKYFVIHREYPQDKKQEIEEFLQKYLYQDSDYENGEIIIVIEINRDQAKDNL